MNNEWIETTVGEYCAFAYGKAIKKSDQKESGIPVYGSNGVYTYADAPLVSRHAVIVGRKGSVGKVHLSSEPCWVSDTAFYVSKDTLEETYFVYYLLSSLGLEDMNTDAAVPGLNRNNAHRLEIKVPSSTDKKVALIKPLIRLDQKIQLNQQINQTLEEMAQALFKSWFVDFEPTKAKIGTFEAGGNEEDANFAAMQAISGKTAAELEQLKAQRPENYQQLYTTAQHFPAAMQDSELGEIPEGWEVLPFKKVIDKYIDNRGKTPPAVENGIPLVEVKHLPENACYPSLKTDKYVTKETFKTWFRSYLQTGDILISTVGTIGRTAIVGNETIGIAQNVLGLRFGEIAVPEFMFYMIKSAYFQHAMEARLVTTVQSSIKRKDLDTIDILVPTSLVQRRFQEIISSLLAKQNTNETEISSLESLRDELLPKLLSGEISLDNGSAEE